MRRAAEPEAGAPGGRVWNDGRSSVGLVYEPAEAPAGEVRRGFWFVNDTGPLALRPATIVKGQPFFAADIQQAACAEEVAGKARVSFVFD